MRKHFCGLAALVTLAFLAGCAAVGESTAPPATATEVAPDVTLRTREPAADAVRFTVVSASSQIRLLTFREGPMARLGHNHVITTTALTGTAWLTDDVGEALVRIVVPANGLAVDDADARAEEGEGFAESVPEDDITATRDNMLGDALLRATDYPFIRATCGDYTAVAQTIDCELEVAGNTAMVTMPVEIVREERVVTARGEVTLTHTQLGLEPYSAAGGAIRVADGITLRFTIVAQRLSD
ncbi:MAG: YceI family protein [Pseudomonadota bacterium]